MCSVCEGYSSAGCPCCSPDPVYIVCENCNGTGYEAYWDDEENDTVTEEVYNTLPEDKRHRDKCSKCHGQGEIEDED